MRIRSALSALAIVLSASTAGAQSVFLGVDTNGPVKQYTTTGSFIGNFGQGGATGSALDGVGHVWTVAPNFGNNQIQKYDASQTVLGTFTATVNGNWIEDMAWGGNNSIWAGTYEGNVFNIDATTGAVNSFFSVANSTFTGVGFDGTNLWLTGGLSGNDNIYQYSTGGALLQTIHTGFNDGMGLGYYAGNLWVGYLSGDVRQYDLNGALLSSFSAVGNAHDGLEVGVIGTTSTPEPASISLLATGLLGIAGFVRRRRKTQTA